jgi:hypothetical protein
VDSPTTAPTAEERKSSLGCITRVENSGKSEEKRIEIDCNGDMRN